jgi:N12 class adenine-specific DNA methylase
LDELEMIKREHADKTIGGLVKELEKAKKRLEAKLQALPPNTRKDNTLTFEELGVDRLFVDEAHYFKNLFYVTKMTRIAGLPQTASERAFDMYLKVRYIQQVNGGGGVVFATGTPIANSMAEMFTMQRYLQPRFEETQPASLRFVGGDVRRAGDGDGTFAGRCGLPAEHAVRAVHQRAGVDADVPPVRRRADRRRC